MIVRRTAALEVPCPRCEVPAGQACRLITLTGERWELHLERRCLAAIEILPSPIAMQRVET